MHSIPRIEEAMNKGEVINIAAPSVLERFERGFDAIVPIGYVLDSSREGSIIYMQDAPTWTCIAPPRARWRRARVTRMQL